MHWVFASLVEEIQLTNLTEYDIVLRLSVLRLFFEFIHEDFGETP